MADRQQPRASQGGLAEMPERDIVGQRHGLKKKDKLSPAEDVSKEHRTEIAVDAGRKLGKEHNKKRQQSD